MREHLSKCNVKSVVMNNKYDSITFNTITFFLRLPAWLAAAVVAAVAVAFVWLKSC